MPVSIVFTCDLFVLTFAARMPALAGDSALEVQPPPSALSFGSPPITDFSGHPRCRRTAFAFHRTTVAFAAEWFDCCTKGER